ncbi:hypothetical protein DB30_03505 [Enhygromyxa salina]|uniref:Uncharacterized protein n=1 Tax=Enhygromyxa salina TaxID=215803 RepID=A0A0C1ZLB2_9BACT|nr:hypothetical protein DB30_03505 [Enhygromyxa salina]
MSVCLPPESDGECKLCPIAEVIDEVEGKISEVRPDCDLQHSEFGCMRTVENAKFLGNETNYCCYQIAIWGPGCKDDTSSSP